MLSLLYVHVILQYLKDPTTAVYFLRWYVFVSIV